jgi:hypothetical protein
MLADMVQQKKMPLATYLLRDGATQRHKHTENNGKAQEIHIDNHRSNPYYNTIGAISGFFFSSSLPPALE